MAARRVIASIVRERSSGQDASILIGRHRPIHDGQEPQHQLHGFLIGDIGHFRPECRLGDIQQAAPSSTMPLIGSATVTRCLG